MKRLGILASHTGTNFQSVIDACESGHINAKPVIAISNNSQAMALQRAQDAGIATEHMSCKTHGEQLDQAMLSAFKQADVDLIVTAGYMKKLGPLVLAHYQGRIINIHPSLLPKHGGKGMFGMNVHRAVIADKDAETGITVHYVDAEYDTGPIIKQTRLTVMEDDTPESLATRVLTHEHQLLIDTLQLLTTAD